MKIGQPPPSGPVSLPPTTTTREPTGQGGIQLSAGQLVRAAVVALHPDGSYLLDIDGQRLTARSALSLPTGGALWLEVKGCAPPWLTIAPQARVAAQELLLLIAGGMGSEQSLQRAAEQLLSLQPGTVLSDRLRQLADQLRILRTDNTSPLDSVLRSLVAFHAGGRQTPLVPLLREIRALLTSTILLPEAGKTGDAVRRLEQFTGLAETVLALNGADPPPGYSIYPAFFENDAGQGQWTITPAGQDQLRLDFYLQMSNLGDVHASFLIGQGNIDGIFAVGDEAAAAHIATGLPQLEKKLVSLNFAAITLASRRQEVHLLQRLRDRVLPETRIGQATLIHITA